MFLSLHPRLFIVTIKLQYIAHNSVFVERKKHIEIARRYKLGAGGVLDLIGKLYAMRDVGRVRIL